MLNRSLSLVSVEGKVEGQLDVNSIVSATKVVANLERSDSRDSIRRMSVDSNDQSSPRGQKGARTTSGESRAERASRKACEDSEYNLLHCARITCTDGQELEVWLQDATQMQTFMTMLDVLMKDEFYKYMDEINVDREANQPSASNQSQETEEVVFIPCQWTVLILFHSAASSLVENTFDARPCSRRVLLQLHRQLIKCTHAIWKHAGANMRKIHIG